MHHYNLYELYHQLFNHYYNEMMCKFPCKLVTKSKIFNGQLPDKVYISYSFYFVIPSNVNKNA
jgi:hypothetical protein